MASWQETYDGVIAKIDAYLEGEGWYKNADGEWEKELVLDNPSYYIGQGPLDAIMEGGPVTRVYGSGAEGVAAFINETYVSDFEDNFFDIIELDDEENEWFEEDEENWDEVSSYIQGWMRPAVDVESIAEWLRGLGYQA